jgi:hypothetical protein
MVYTLRAVERSPATTGPASETSPVLGAALVRSRTTWVVPTPSAATATGLTLAELRARGPKGRP